MCYTEKQIGQLAVGDFVLHPIYRKDGLILITRYKQVTESVRIHIFNHCSAGARVVVALHDDDLTRFTQHKHYADLDFITMLHSVADDSNRQLSYPLPFRAYVDPLAMQEDEPLEAVSGFTVRGVPTGYQQHLHVLFTNPLWDSLELRFDSTSMQKRALEVKKRVSQTLEHDGSVHQMFDRMQNYHDALFIHSVNVMSITLLIGLTLEMSNDDIHDLCLAGLFSDIGYTDVKLSEFVGYLNHGHASENIQAHIRHSIEHVQTSPSCRSKSIIHGILDHHEMCDGSGYPFGKQIEDISLYGRIIAIAQGYDALAGGYFAEQSISVWEAQAYMWSNRQGKYDDKILSVFFYRRQLCKIGQTIVLQSGRKGRIEGFTDFLNFPLHPVVVFDEGEKVDFYLLRNLSSVQDIYLESPEDRNASSGISKVKSDGMSCEQG